MAEFESSASFIPSLHKPSSLLPVARHREVLLYLIESLPITIVVGQTGSGKTTQIPQYLDQAGWCTDGRMVAVTQVGELFVCAANSASHPPNSSVASESGSYNRSGKSCRGSRM